MAWHPTMRATMFSNAVGRPALAPALGQVAVRGSLGDGASMHPAGAAFHPSPVGSWGHANATFHGINLSGARSGSIGRAGFSGGGG
jgi:hypothetical protein